MESLTTVKMEKGWSLSPEKNNNIMKQYLLGFIIIFTLCLFSCNQKKQKEIYSEDTSTPLANYETWADTIIYEVLVNNPDSSDEWQGKKIKYLNRKKMVDDIFASIYNGKKKAYNYYTNQEMNIAAIKELEDDYKREDVGKVQFTESWFYNTQTGIMQKKIYNILIAYTLYSYDNKIRGYKAAFYVKN